MEFILLKFKYGPCVYLKLFLKYFIFLILIIFAIKIIYSNYIINLKKNYDAHNNYSLHHSVNTNKIVLQESYQHYLTRMEKSKSKLHLEKKEDVSNNLIKTKYIIKNNLNIFFIEPSCSLKKYTYLDILKNNRGIHLDARQACAIESAAKYNKNSTIYILHSCLINRISFEDTPQDVLKIFNYTNVKIVYLNITDYFQQTPLEDLLANGNLKYVRSPLKHIDHALRVLTLWKYGGTYFDLDIISMRPIEELGFNFAGYKSEGKIGEGVLNFKAEGNIFVLLTRMLNNFNRYLSFNTGQDNNESNLISYSLSEFCETAKSVRREANKKTCDGITIYDPIYFYPINSKNWLEFIQENDNDKILAKLNNSYVVHLWEIYDETYAKESEFTYNNLAAKCCSLTHSEMRLK